MPMDEVCGYMYGETRQNLSAYNHWRGPNAPDR
ncbi:hypothetical protein [Echinococcus multilocularis]|uniref:Uncharacterized protein n=1 Tax=Echinococcus multilocularis TaxID=6211 RepID=A0A068YE39_ECHMU|nr:hypothetical protein [Echinococcus multilocularis]